MTLFIEQSEKSFIEILLIELSFETNGEISFKDNKNDLIYIFNESTTDEKIAFNNNLIEISIKLFSDNSTSNENLKTEFIETTTINSEDIEIYNRFKLLMNFTELKFTTTEEYIVSDNTSDKTLNFDYKPNCVHNWILNRTLKQSHGFVINITKFELDLDSGDYLIIGSEIRPKLSYSSKSLIITNVLNRNLLSIYFNSNIAYIQIITHGSTKRGLTLQIVWSTVNKTSEPIPQEPYITDRLRQQALHICVRTDNEQQCADKKLFIYLKTFFSRILNRLIFEGSLKYEQLINDKSVLIFDKEYRIGNSFSYCSAKLAITRNNDHRITAFDKNILDEKLFREGNYLIDSRNNITITDCNFSEITTKEIYEIIVYIVIPFVFVLLIFWRFSKNRYFVSNETLEKFRKYSAINDLKSYENSSNSNKNFYAFNENESFEGISENQRISRMETLDRKTSYEEQIPIIELKVMSKQRASIFDTRNFSAQQLCSSKEDSFRGQHLNKSI